MVSAAMVSAGAVTGRSDQWRTKRAPRGRPQDRAGLDPIFHGAADFDLELIEHRTLDGHIQELVYQPTLHV